MADPENEVPEGAAVFPLIPPELGIHPLLLSVIHATVFLAGSDEKILNRNAADEAIQYMADYLRRLTGKELLQVREDMACLVAFAKQGKWSTDLVELLASFLDDYDVGEEGGN
jgi:hypothetical protein